MFLVTEEDGDVPQEYLIPKYELADLCSEAAKLKSLGAMAIVPPERLVRLLNILEKNIRDGGKVTPIVDEVNNCLCYCLDHNFFFAISHISITKLHDYTLCPKTSISCLISLHM